MVEAREEAIDGSLASLLASGDELPQESGDVIGRPVRITELMPPHRVETLEH